MSTPRYIHRPLIPLAMAAFLGCCLGWLSLPVGVWIWVLMGSALSIGAAFLRRSFWGTLFILMAVFSVYAGRAELARMPAPDSIAHWVSRRDIVLEGTLAGLLQAQPVYKRWSGTIRCDQVVWHGHHYPTRGAIRFSLPGSIPDWNPGDRVRIRGRLLPLPEAKNPGELDSRAYYQRQGVLGVLRGWRPEDGIRLQPAATWSWGAIAGGLRRKLGAGILASTPKASCGLINALVTGDRSGFSLQESEVLAVAGLSHLLAVSGMNVGIIFATMIFLAQGLRLPRAVGVVAGLLAVGLLVLSTGGEAPVLRAGLMLAGMALAMVGGRPADPASGLAFSSLLILGWDPGAALDPGFQLSYAATAGILTALRVPMPKIFSGSSQTKIQVSLGNLVTMPVGQVPVRAHWPRSLSDVHNNTPLLQSGARGDWENCPTAYANPPESPFAKGGYCRKTKIRQAPRSARVIFWLLKFLTQSVLFSLFAFIFTLPLTLFYFYSATPIGLLTNIAAAPLLDLIVISGTLAGCVHAVWPGLATLAGAVAGWAGQGLKLVAQLGMMGSWGRIFIYPPPAFWVAGFYILLVAGMIPHRFRVIILVGFLPWCWCYPAFQPQPVAAQASRLTFLSLAIGESTLLEISGHRWLVDTGSEMDFLRRVKPFLASQGINHLDGLWISHWDQDHAAGTEACLQFFHVERLYTSGVHPQGVHADPVPRYRNTLVVICRRGECLSWGKVTAQILWPPPGEPKQGNAHCLAMRFNLGTANVVFPGDSPGGIENQWTETAASTLLKVGHHGSRSSSPHEFLERIQPTLAVVMPGNHNPFGFPHAETLERLHAHSGIILNTCDHGAIRVHFQAEGVEHWQVWE